MILDKPAWLVHLGPDKKPAPIYSLHVCSRGSRIATGGGDNLVKIWTAAVQEEPAAPLLAALNTHERAVNCVRWSAQGDQLASGSDDKAVIVWGLGAGRGGTAFGAAAENNLENWRAVALLRGHSMDVLGVGWSPDGSRLASCSIDNTVRVWQAGSWSCAKVITAHCSIVKGLEWDPLGKYLLTQAEDSKAIIWRAADWTVEKQISAVFEDKAGEAMFNRSCWSPDGRFLLLVAARVRGHHAAVAYERGSWEEVGKMTGHDDGVVLTAGWNPKVFKRNPTNKQDAVQMLFALGSAEPRVSIWTTDQSESEEHKALLVLSELFEPQKPVLDICWTADGLGLLACSADGTVASVQFERSELGQPLSEQEQALLLQQQPGFAVLDPAAIPETLANAAQPTGTPPAAPPPHSPLAHSLIARPSQQSEARQQTESRLPNGKRRICPTRVATELGPPAAKHARLEPQPVMEVAARASDVCPAVAKRLLCKIGTMTIEVTAQPDGQTSQVVCTAEDGSRSWSSYTPAPGSALAGCGRLVAVGCADGQLYLLSPATGRWLLPPIQLSRAVAFLACGPDGWLAALSADGELMVWDMSQMRLASRGSAAGMLSAGKAVLGMELHPNGIAVLTVSSGAGLAESFALSPQLGSWLRLTDQTRARFSADLLQGSQPTAEAAVGNIEIQLYGAMLLGKSEQADSWWDYYLRHLAGSGAQARLVEIGTQLQDQRAEGLRLGWVPPQARLEQMVPILRTNKGLASLASEYEQLLAGQSKQQRGLAHLMAGAQN